MLKFISSPPVFSRQNKVAASNSRTVLLRLNIGTDVVSFTATEVCPWSLEIYRRLQRLLADPQP
jgi:hypothetical protein